MALLADRNTAFIHIPRTGGTLVERLLGISFDWRLPNLDRLVGCLDDSGRRFMLQHLTCEEMIQHRFVEAERFAQLFKFTIVRNPIFRTSSLYYYWGGKQQWGDFESFLEYAASLNLNTYDHSQSHRGIRYHLIPQYKYVYGEDGRLLVDRICRFEYYLDDVKETFDMIGLSLDTAKIDENRLNLMTDSYQKLYSEPVMEFVKTIYAKDFELFDYYDT